MSGMKRAQASRLAPVNVKDQVGVTHNSGFPFSALTVDDDGSFRTIHSGKTALSQNPYVSPASSTPTLTDCESGAASDQDAWHLERYSEVAKPNNAQPLFACNSNVKTANRAVGLHIITDFSKPTYHTNNLMIDEVPARQAVTRTNHARSIISQKGVKLNVMDTVSNDDNTSNKSQKRRAVLLPSNNSSPNIDTAQSEKKIVIGFRVAQNEAHLLYRQDELSGGHSLSTPHAPAIILTPPEERLMALPIDESSPLSKISGRRPISSVYTTITCSREADRHHYDVDEDDEVPPLPTISSFIKGNTITTPIIPQAQRNFNSLASSRHKGPLPSRLQIDKSPAIHDACDTPRSQGWWNVLLSPLLSRNGSIASRKTYDKDVSPPPVPNMPKNLQEIVTTNTPKTNISPETPRRLGLAGTPGATWSNWGEWEREVGSINKEIGCSQAMETRTPESAFRGKVFPAREPLPYSKEGLAAEYYHACAIEQLTGATYFECINHSCEDHLPKLGSCSSNARTLDESANGAVQPLSASKKVIVLGSPFKSDLGSDSITQNHTRVDVRDEDESITDIESDVDMDDVSPLVKKPTSSKARDILTPTSSENEPDELSPNVREANTAAFTKARARGITEVAKSTPRVKHSDETKQIPNIAAFVMGDMATQLAQLHPLEAHLPKQGMMARSLEKPVPALPASFGFSTPNSAHSQLHSQQSKKHQISSQQFFMNPKGGFSGLPATPAAVPTSFPRSQRAPSPVGTTRSSEPDLEKRQILVVKDRGHSNKSRACTGMKLLFKSTPDKTKKEKKRRRQCAICICVFLLLIIILCIILAMTLRRKGTHTSIESRWLNLTGYPPMPVGISTIAQPDLAHSQTGCVQPATLWSCALPKDDQQRATSNGSSTPNFRFEIQYRNGTTPANMNIPLRKRDDPFLANPAPPNDADQLFLGNTTDNNTAPFNGEITPFYITFRSTYPATPAGYNTTTSILSTRQDLGINIPAPNTLSDGTAYPASLLPSSPFPSSQPVRLYNRGHEDEHYGFYIYYDKVIFLSGINISGGNSSTSAAGTKADQDGGSIKDAAKVQCTWRQTRFLVKIYTNAKFTGSLIPGRPNMTLDTSTQSKFTSATFFSQPGSFPYPTSIIIDRHGGNINSKITYCYAMDKGMINANQKSLVLENRSAGGTLMNGAPAFVDSTKKQPFDSSAGGIDGGTGGCGCTWQNWR